jgi:hypothetical protein
MGEIPGRSPIDVVVDPDYLRAAHSVYAAVKESTREGLRVRKGRFYERQTYGPTFRITYNDRANEGTLEIEEALGLEETLTAYHFREDSSPVLITGHVGRHLSRNRIAIYYVEDPDNLEPGDLDEREGWAKAIKASINDILIAGKIVNNPIANANLLNKLTLLR